MATLTQFKILQILSRRKQGTREICDKLAENGISLTLRSVQRNLEKLSDIFPITSDHLNPAGWNWAENCELLDLPTMDVSTALTLRMAEQYLAPMLPKSCLKNLHPYMRRARNLLDEINDTGVGIWHKRVARVSRTQQLISPQVDAEVLDNVFQATLDAKQISVDYRGIGESEVLNRRLHPLGLVFTDAAIYLVCTVWDYEDVRQFALHRIESAELLELPAKENLKFNLDDYISANNFEFPLDGKSIKLKLKADDWLTGYLEENQLSRDQKITRGDASSVIVATIQDTLQIQWWLMGMGTHVEVLEPAELRKKFRDLAKNLHNTYWH